MADHIAVDITESSIASLCGVVMGVDSAEGDVFWDRDSLASEVSPEFVTARACRDCLERDRAGLAR